MKRIRDFRPTWKLRLSEQVSGNYYPVTSKILIRDERANTELAILTDRAQGGSSLSDGEIELMVNSLQIAGYIYYKYNFQLHRSCLHDDSFGVGEALNEQAFGKGLVVRGSHYLILGPYKTESIAAQERDLAQRKLLNAWTFISPTGNLSFEEYSANLRLQVQ